MHLLPLLLSGACYSTIVAAAAAPAATVSPLPAFNKQDLNGPEIWGSYNEIEDCEMHQAIECLHDQICARRNVPIYGKIRCTIGSSVAYLCNYRKKGDKFEDEIEAVVREGNRKKEGGELTCDHREMYEAWRQIRIAKGSHTGWWYDGKGKKTYGFDRRCKDGECDNGWMTGSEWEQCTNIKKSNNDWLFDYEAPEYLNYTGRFEQHLPDPANDFEPVYFNPWYEGKRPK
ncbi:uncharacterized protein PODANS_4_2270 [Podospora anserina S mat+]|uniref:Podospora anserina S mat+ genomic DNA chromosome 4, supercontig 1 n=1 Tax=Podospora anserina (strain S / ATCC MYA-4624 / DSM 980 / FGSC 10383) TaxID=515849 RepID=B2ADW4_PODAN|nr:uncharacterized protein PODANS_4_2270 [Podospora anserina S mat+]CAP61629.1 unnamed protein product [Podospora anserina S mat+]CDP27983.1 Putative protein of unknown function [Podospora anserina S mat+]